jgi:hypothetical protein
MNSSTTPRRGQLRDKPFRDALRMEAALAERSEPTPAPPGSLRSIARNLLDRADKCTLAAREVADRLDGRVAARVVGDDDEPPVRFASIDLSTLTDEQLRTLNAIVWQLEQPSDR